MCSLALKPMVAGARCPTGVREARNLGRSPDQRSVSVLSCSLDCANCRIHDYLLWGIIHRRARADRACGRSAETRTGSSAKTRAARSAEPGPIVGSKSRPIARTEPVIRTRTVTKAKSTTRATIHAGATRASASAVTASVDVATGCNHRILGRIEHKFPLIVVGLLLVDLDRRFLVQQSNSHDRSSTDTYARRSEGTTAAPGRLHSPDIVGCSVGAGRRRPASAGRRSEPAAGTGVCAANGRAG